MNINGVMKDIHATKEQPGIYDIIIVYSRHVKCVVLMSQVGKQDTISVEIKGFLE